ncbi:NTP transferase domain-containing protein [Candidatus Margulisiibacteriota bacterium]
MAGHSRRFKAAGYSTPKPFIMIDGQPMIQSVCQMFSPMDEFIFVCHREHLDHPEYRDILENSTRNYHIIPVDPHEYGPIYSALQAEPLITNKQDEPVIISYCDFTMQWDYRQFVCKAAQYEGAMAVFRGFHPASFGDTYYAYLRSTNDLEMLELREKRSFTDKRHDEFASTGVYYLDSWETFAQYANELISKKETVSSEYYCSLLYNPMVRDGKRITLFEVDKFICWGTPEDLEEYFFWSEYFSRDVPNLLKRV